MNCEQQVQVWNHADYLYRPISVYRLWNEDHVVFRHAAVTKLRLISGNGL